MVLQKITLFKSLILWLTCSCKYFPAYALKGRVEPGSDDCYLSSKTERLQIAIVGDQTGSNIDNLNKALGNNVGEIVNGVNEIHKDTEFAITTHANWDDSTHHLDPRHNEPERCYTRDLNFTTDISEITRVAKGIKRRWGSNVLDPEENSMSAICFTVTDKNLGWVPSDVDSQGRHIHRIVILFTDVYSIFELVNPGNRTEFKGDGTDDCLISKPATEDIAARILKSLDIVVIGAYVGMKDDQYEKYENYFQKYNLPYKAQRFKDTSDLNKHIVNFIKETVQDLLKCVYEDPPSYNTLGL